MERLIYSTDVDIEPLIEGYIGERKNDKQFFPVFVGFLIGVNVHCVSGSEADSSTKKLIEHYRNLILAPAIVPAQNFMLGTDDMIGKEKLS